MFLIKLNLVAPATNAILERGFSTWKRAKTSILSTMAGSRLAHLLLIPIYKEELDEVNIKFKKLSLLK